MKNRLEDIELIAKFRAGDSKAFEELLARYEEKAFRLAMRMTRDSEDAEEALQDAFTTVFRKIDGFKGESSFSSWFYRVTVNACLMKIRKRRQNRCIFFDDIEPHVNITSLLQASDSVSSDHSMFIAQLRLALQEAIQELPEEYRSVFILRDIDGLSSKEVAQLLQLSVSAVKSRLHRSRLALRRTLAQVYREAAPGYLNDKSVGNL